MKKETIAKRAAGFILSISNEEIQNLNVKDIAAAVNKNKILLSWIFKREQKISMPIFILREKIYRAAYILEKDHTILIPELSERLGFASPYQFEKIFDYFFCVFPGKYQALKKKIKNRTKQKTNPGKLKKNLEPLRH